MSREFRYETPGERSVGQGRGHGNGRGHGRERA